jgi:GntR family transcriptional regulator
MGFSARATFITGTLEPVTLPELAGLRRQLLSWLKAASEAGLDEAGVAALLANVTRDYYGGRAARPENENAGNEGVA